jgi:hypothetical protein
VNRHRVLLVLLAFAFVLECHGGSRRRRSDWAVAPTYRVTALQGKPACGQRLRAFAGQLVRSTWSNPGEHPSACTSSVWRSLPDAHRQTNSWPCSPFLCFISSSQLIVDDTSGVLESCVCKYRSESHLGSLLWQDVLGRVRAGPDTPREFPFGPVGNRLFSPDSTTVNPA